ncbi:hypothetical protein NPJ88_006520 [Halomonas elongata]|uniref:hypothetical protein n=1 Tax=Halomonas elongata TaxID=2746 RepID=UPI00255AC08A|nr:hypothetical protein [Halomonas elongata]MDL4861980.1 hypothetical protein [Halomonas elongata]
MSNDRPSIKLSGTSHRLHYSDLPWNELTGFRVQTPSGTWPAGQNMNAAQKVQETALVAFDEAGRAILDATSNNDLTPEAKQRLAQQAADSYFQKLDPKVKALADSMASLAEGAPRMLSATQELKSTDTVGELRDQELRNIIRTAGQKERQSLVVAMSANKQPEMTRAVLRAPAVASALTTDAVESLRHAGIAAGYPDTLRSLRNMLMARDDVIRTAIAGADSLRQLHPGASQMAAQTRGVEER